MLRDLRFAGLTAGGFLRRYWQRKPLLARSALVECAGIVRRDTLFSLAGRDDRDRGWGVADETWTVIEELGRYGEETWFRLGDRDIATHIVRTARLRDGDRPTEVALHLQRALGVRATVLPMTDDRVRTAVRTDDGWLSFQDYFVRRRQEPTVHDVRFDGVETAGPTPEVMAALAAAASIVIAPSNPIVSVGPILALPGIRETLLAAAHRGLGARMVPFAGYVMPVQYPTGIIAEHVWTRTHAGLFDVSHMGPSFLRLEGREKDVDASHRTIAAIAETLRGLARLRSRKHDVLLLPNLYGDIVSDLTAGLVGGLGLAPGANIGTEAAVFEATHGSAPKYKGQNRVNPTAMILSGKLMLEHLGERDAAAGLEQAVADVIAEGERVTYDLKPTRDDPTAVGTSEFADAIIEKLA